MLTEKEIKDNFTEKQIKTMKELGIIPNTHKKNRTRKLKWTHEIRKYLYEELYRECGAYGDITFTNKTKTSFSKKMVKKLLSKFNLSVTDKAIRQQIDWGFRGNRGR